MCLFVNDTDSDSRGYSFTKVLIPNSTLQLLVRIDGANLQ